MPDIDDKELEKYKNISKEPFRSYNLEEEGLKVDTFTVRLNVDERIRLNKDKKILQQKKDSTALKQLASIGSIVIHDKKIAEILGVVMGNSRRNKRNNIVDFEEG